MNKMTDSERLALADKLDRDLDEFINGLERKPYAEGWPEDRWQEEFDKHPFFMQKAPEAGDELHPLLEGIQQLKYDPAENTAEELAASYKEDGNFNFKHRKYRLAVLSYTEGLKQLHANDALRATLHNNRAAAHFHLKNFRSALNDCRAALQLDAAYSKAALRAAHCALALQQFDNCVQFCDTLLLAAAAGDTTNRAAPLALRQKAINAHKDQQRDVRRRQKRDAHQTASLAALNAVLKTRGVKLATQGSLQPVLPQLQGAQVSLDAATGELHWPVAVMYPEYGTIDFIREFNENHTFAQQFQEIFAENSSWDREGRYTVDSVSVYFEEKPTTQGAKVTLHAVDVLSTLGHVLQHPGAVVHDGTPHFIVLLRGSPRERSFLEKY